MYREPGPSDGSQDRFESDRRRIDPSVIPDHVRSALDGGRARCPAAPNLARGAWRPYFAGSVGFQSTVSAPFS